MLHKTLPCSLKKKSVRSTTPLKCKNKSQKFFFSECSQVRKVKAEVCPPAFLLLFTIRLEVRLLEMQVRTTRLLCRNSSKALLSFLFLQHALVRLEVECFAPDPVDNLVSLQTIRKMLDT